MNEINDYSEPETIDYQEKDLTNEIKRKSILFFKLILIISLIMLTFTLFWSILK